MLTARAFHYKLVTPESSLAGRHPAEHQHSPPSSMNHITIEMEAHQQTNTGNPTASQLLQPEAVPIMDQHACRSTVKIPKFLSFDVDLWEAQVQACFQIHGITSEKQKYFNVLAVLDPESMRHITAYISQPTEGNEFNGLVAALKLAFQQSDGDKIDAIFNMNLGDQKPSLLYSTLRRLWLDKDPDQSKMLRHIFIRKLPSSVAVLLRSITNISMNEFLQAADSMVDQHKQQENVMLANKIESKDNVYSHNVDRAKSNNKPQNERRYPPMSSEGICNYHAKWGSRAFKCRPGCKFVPQPSEKVNVIGPSSDKEQKLELPPTWGQHRAVRLQQCVDGRPIITDTGSSYSLLPARHFEKKRKPDYSLFKGAQGVPIPVYGQREIFVDIGTGRKFRHMFFIAGVEDPLLGLDFLLEHRLAVDPVHERLIDVDTYLTAPVNTVMINTITATNESSGKFQHLWKEFPGLCDAIINKLALKPKHNIQHDIILKPGARPVTAKPRRLFGPKLKAAQEEFDLMMKLGIVRRSNSDWASPLHIVPKGKGSYRPCGDFRQLNSLTIGDRYPLPHVQDFVSSLEGTTIFSKIDLVRAFHQIPLAKAAIPKTAVTTPFGLFEFTRMPFGLCNAAQAFQRFIDMVTKNLQGVHTYIDDILVATDNMHEHEKILRQLFMRLTEYGLVVNPTKSILGAEEVQFLGFTVNKNGVSPMKTKVSAILDFPSPTTFGQLSEFLGMVNFYHRFIPKCSDTAKPLYQLLKNHNMKKTSKKPIPINAWNSVHDKSFHNLKITLSKATTLSFPSHEKATRLVTDASDYAVGAVLEQKNEKGWKAIAFFSKVLREPELKYSAYDRELLAIKLSLQHFRHMVEGIPSELFHIATDHKPLTTGKNFTVDGRSQTQLNRVTRTWQFISELTTDIRHISGNDNPVADALSRNSINKVKSSPLLELISTEQERINMRPSNTEKWPDHWKIQKHHGFTLAVDTRAITPRPIVPPSLTKAVFDEIHNMAHLGVKATRKLIGASYVWQTMTKDIQKWVKQCIACQSSKVSKHNKAPYQTFPEPSGKFQHIHIDIVGPLPTNQNYTYLLTVIDRFSRWPAAIPIKGITAQECAEALINGWIQYYGTPTNIVTDRGRQFTSALWNETCNILGSTHSCTTAYHPQSNGMIERFHRHLKSSLMATASSSRDWLKSLPMVMLGIRTAIKEDLGASSADIVYGEPIRIPGGFFPEIDSKLPDNYIEDLQEGMAKKKYISPDWHGQCNTGHELSSLKTCTHVFVLESGLKKPLQRPYKGPYEILQRGDKVFIIKLPGGKQDKVSVDRLKPAYLDKSATMTS